MNLDLAWRPMDLDLTHPDLRLELDTSGLGFIFWDLDLRPVDLALRPMNLDLTHLDSRLGLDTSGLELGCFIPK